MKLHIKKEFGNTGEDIATEYLEKTRIYNFRTKFLLQTG